MKKFENPTLEQVDDFIFKNETSLVKPIKGTVARWNAGGFGFIKLEDGEQIFAHESTLCEHLEDQKNGLAGKKVSVKGVTQAAKGKRADTVECDACAQPELWEIYEVDQINGVPNYQIRCTNKPDKKFLNAPYELTLHLKELNKPYEIEQSKKWAWGEGTKVTSNYFFSSFGKPEEMRSQNGELELHYKNFGIKILTGEEADKVKGILGLEVQPALNQEIKVNESGVVELNYSFTEFPDVIFKKPINLPPKNGILIFHDLLNSQPEDTIEKVYAALREGAKPIEDLVHEYFFGEAEIEEYVDSFLNNIILLEYGEKPKYHSREVVEQHYGYMSPDERLYVNSYTESVQVTTIEFAPILSKIGALKDFPDFVYMESGLKIGETSDEKVEKYIQNQIQNLRDSYLKININSEDLVNESVIKIYDMSTEDFKSKIETELEKIRVDFIARYERKKAEVFAKFAEAIKLHSEPKKEEELPIATNTIQNTVNQIPIEEKVELSNRDRKIQLFEQRETLLIELLAKITTEHPEISLDKIYELVTSDKKRITIQESLTKIFNSVNESLSDEDRDLLIKINQYGSGDFIWLFTEAIRKLQSSKNQETVEQENVDQEVEEIAEDEVIYETTQTETFPELLPGLRKSAEKILEIASNHGLEEIEDLLVEYEKAKNKEEQNKIISKIFESEEDPTELVTFLNMKQSYKLQIIDAVINEIDRRLNQ